MRLHSLKIAWKLPRRSVVSNALIVAGAMLLLYVGWAYFMMWQQQRTLSKQWAQRYEQPANHSEVLDDGLVRVVIPKADVDAIVVNGVTHKLLAVGPGHMPSTPMPGEAGNAVISAHRDTFFRHIGDLRNGDQVIVHRGGSIFQFAVKNKKIVKPNDMSVIQPTGGAELTLITCYPTYFIGPAPKRLVVVSELVRTLPDTGNAVATTSER
jgi:LPXTG-site transpeptidase (sortase) family protein